MIYKLRREQWVPQSLEEVFAFFSDARNLEALTPAWLNFEILTPGPISMAPGTKIDYRLKWHGIRLDWTTEIVAWKPPHAFEDVQRSGPYASWHHIHYFEAAGNGTRLVDMVRYALPFGWLGRAVHAVAVRRNVERIFEYRHSRIREILGEPDRGRA